MAFMRGRAVDEGQGDREPSRSDALDAVDSIKVFEDHIVRGTETYVLASATHADTFVDTTVSGDGSGFISSPPRIELVVAHPTYAWSHVAEGEDRLSEMRRLAARINALARAQAVPTGSLGVADQLAQLGELHAAGRLSDAEFEQAKAAVIGG